MAKRDNPSIRRVSDVRIREIFNSSQHPAAIQNREYIEQILSDDPVPAATARRRRWPRGTRSQYVRYLNSRREVMVEVHRFRKPDGTLAASGRPDPKLVRIGNVIYRFDPEII
jgi:hypothetical protein